jgi:hypothetical protein
VEVTGNKRKSASGHTAALGMAKSQDFFCGSDIIID